MSSRYTAVLFDLDGTIVDSAPGITATLAKTFVRLGLPVPSPAELLAYVGPPILDSFRDLAGFDLAESHARPRHLPARSTWSPVSTTRPSIPGSRTCCAASTRRGLPLSLATSKPELPATLVLEHYDLTQYFDELTGASADETRSKKADVVAEALRRLREDGADLSNTGHGRRPHPRHARSGRARRPDDLRDLGLRCPGRAGRRRRGRRHRRTSCSRRSGSGRIGPGPSAPAARRLPRRGRAPPSRSARSPAAAARSRVARRLR